jgi:hypothetical protein
LNTGIVKSSCSSGAVQYYISVVIKLEDLQYTKVAWKTINPDFLTFNVVSGELKLIKVELKCAE